MKLEVFAEKKKKEEPPVLVKLLPREGGHGVKLVVVDASGTPKQAGIILTISNDGEIRLLSSADPAYGFNWTTQDGVAAGRG